MLKNAWMLIPAGMLIAACASPAQTTPATPTPPALPTVTAAPSHALPPPLATLSPAPASFATGPGSTAPPQDACPIEQPPGPGDEPPRDPTDLMDNSDLGGGRWRLCTDAAVVESSAWCEWDARRARVVEVSGLPEQGVDVAYAASLAFARAELELSVTDWTSGSGLVLTYSAPFDLDTAAIASDGFGGIAAFTVTLQVDPETGPVLGVPTMYNGLIRWRCGAAPQP